MDNAISVRTDDTWVQTASDLGFVVVDSLDVVTETETWWRHDIPLVLCSGERVLARVVELLGEGGWGRVYRMTWGDGVEAALKVLTGRDIGGPTEVQTTDLERRHLERLRGVAGVPQLLGQMEGADGVVMTLAPGQTLYAGFREEERMRAALRGDVPLPSLADARSAAAMLEKLMEVLEAIHARGVVHRDANPRNILVDGKGRCTLIDFGMSVTTDDDNDWSRCRVGMPGYTPPEQALGRRADARSDLYTVAVSVHRAATGALPSSTAAPNALNPHISDAFNALLSELLAVHPDDRPDTAEEVRRRVLATPELTLKGSEQP